VVDVLDRKLAQMVLVGFRGAEPDECRPFLDSIHECPIAGVWLTDADGPLGITVGNVQSPEQVRRLTRELQRASDVPLLVAVDGEGGEVIRLKPQYGFPEFPSPQTIGHRDDLAFTRAQAERLAGVLAECRINLNMGAIQSHYPLEQAIEMSVLAGADIILHANLAPHDPRIAQRTIAILRGLVRAGKLSESRVERSYERVTALKQKAGIL
jgi:beta-glucosidase-like glycosyl hydrolase